MYVYNPNFFHPLLPQEGLLLGRIKEAKETFENMLKHSNHLMLFSEEIDFNDCNELLGNFPQAITHLGVIRAAIKLNNVLGKSSE